MSWVEGYPHLTDGQAEALFGAAASFAEAAGALHCRRGEDVIAAWWADTARRLRLLVEEREQWRAA